MLLVRLTTPEPAARMVIPTPVLPGRNCARTVAASMTVLSEYAARQAARSIPRRPRLLTAPTAPMAAGTPVITPVKLTALRAPRKPTPADAAVPRAMAAATRPATILTRPVAQIPVREAHPNITPVHMPERPDVAAAAITARDVLPDQLLIPALMSDHRNAVLVTAARIPAVPALSPSPAPATMLKPEFLLPSADPHATNANIIQTVT